MKQIPWRECGWAVLFALALFGFYVGAYYAMAHNTDDRHTMRGYSYRIGPYYIDGLAAIFSPVHRVDMSLRPHFWAIEWQWVETFGQSSHP